MTTAITIKNYNYNYFILKNAVSAPSNHLWNIGTDFQLILREYSTCVIFTLLNCEIYDVSTYIITDYMHIKYISIILGSDKNMYIIYFIVLFIRVMVWGGGGRRWFWYNGWRFMIKKTARCVCCWLK